MTDSSTTFPLVIVGGGLAGLTAAAHLAERGIPPLVLDVDSRWPGGRLAGGDPDRFDYCGRTWSFPSEHGIHALWGGYANMRATLERFAPVTLQPSYGEEWINRWRREVRRIEAGRMVKWGWIPAPLHYLNLLFDPRFWSTITPLDFLSLPGFLFSLFWTLGLDPIKEGIALDGLMLDEYFRGWTPNLRATFTGLAVNLLASPKEQISLTGMIAAIRFYTMLRRDSWSMSYLPDNPHACIIQPLIDFIRSKGGEVLHGSEALRAERGTDRSQWRVVFHDAIWRGIRSIYTTHIILAMNAPGAQRLLLNSPDTAPEAQSLRFPGTVRNATVRLWFSQSPPDGVQGGMFTGDFLPDNFLWLHRLYDEFREWHEVTGGSAVELHLYAGDAVLEQPDNVLIIRCVDEVQRAFPEIRGSFVQGVIRRNSRVHTQFRVPTMDTLQLKTPWEGIYACGDWIAYPTPALWMERACTTAIAAANEVLLAHGLEPYPILQPASPESLARGLAWVVRLFRKTIGRALLSLVRAARFRQKSEYTK
jgi:isorenieratene synthase